MGYAGYAPAKLPPSKATGLQAALWSIDNMECLEVCQSLKCLCNCQQGLLLHQAVVHDTGANMGAWVYRS